MSAAIETDGLGKRYGRRWALHDCSLTIPDSKVVGLVGPNGAGKTTLLHLAVGLLAPTTGAITVMGGKPGDSPAGLGAQRFGSRQPGAPPSAPCERVDLVDTNRRPFRPGPDTRGARQIMSPALDRERATATWVRNSSTGPARHPGGPPRLRHGGRQAVPHAGHLPAGQPILGISMVRAGDLPRSCQGAGRSVCLGDPASLIPSCPIGFVGLRFWLCAGC